MVQRFHPLIVFLCLMVLPMYGMAESKSEDYSYMGIIEHFSDNFSDSELIRLPELTKWVLAPCMEISVAMSLAESAFSEEFDSTWSSEDPLYKYWEEERKALAQVKFEIILQVKRKWVAEMLATVGPSVSWEERKAIYPTLLRHCLDYYTGKEYLASGR